MAEVNQDLIGRTLALYKPEQRVLMSADVDYPLARGIFLIGPTYYTLEPCLHATVIEAQLCLNQLIYVAVAQLIEDKKIPGLRGLDFLALQKEFMLIKRSDIDFKKPLKTSSQIRGEIRFEGYKQRGNLLVSDARFEFEDKSCLGSLRSIIILPKEH